MVKVVATAQVVAVNQVAAVNQVEVVAQVEVVILPLVDGESSDLAAHFVEQVDARSMHLDEHFVSSDLRNRDVGHRQAVSLLVILA